MQAVVITKPGGPDVLKLENRPMPVPTGAEVLVKVQATAVNRADIIQTRGFYPAPKDVPADIPGLEFAGIVEKCGPSVDEFSPGDRVFGLVGGGAYCEYLCIHSRCLAPIPQNLNFDEAAAIPEAFITAYDALVSQLKMQTGESLLIHAVGSGVGLAAVQIAKLIGATTIGSSRQKNKLEKSYERGLNKGIHVTANGFSDEVMSMTNGKGVDIILDLVGGNYSSQNINCLANKGRMIIVGLVAGAKTEMDLAKILGKRLTIKGTTLRARPLEEKIAVMQCFRKHLLPHFESGKLRPDIDKVLPIQSVQEAFEYVISDQNFGKVVLTL